MGNQKPKRRVLTSKRGEGATTQPAPETADDRRGCVSRRNVAQRIATRGPASRASPLPTERAGSVTAYRLKTLFFFLHLPPEPAKPPHNITADKVLCVHKGRYSILRLTYVYVIAHYIYKRMGQNGSNGSEWQQNEPIRPGLIGGTTSSGALIHVRRATWDLFPI